MPIAHVNGVDLAYEEYGDDFPLIWVLPFKTVRPREPLHARTD